MPSGATFRGLPWTDHGAVLPPSSVEKNHVTFGDFDVLHLFERLKVFTVDRRAWLEPAFWRLARKQRRIEQDRARNHAVLQRNNAAFRTPVRRLHVLKCPT